MNTKEFLRNKLIIIKLHGESINWKFISIEDASDTSNVWFGRIDSITSISIGKNLLKINILGANNPIELSVRESNVELKNELTKIFNKLKSLMIELSI